MLRLLRVPLAEEPVLSGVSLLDQFGPSSNDQPHDALVHAVLVLLGFAADGSFLALIWTENRSSRLARERRFRTGFAWRVVAFAFLLRNKECPFGVLWDLKVVNAVVGVCLGL